MWEDSSATPKLLHTLGLPGMWQHFWLQREVEGPLVAGSMAVLHSAEPLTPAHAAAQLRSPPTPKEVSYKCFPVPRKITWAWQTQESIFC